MSALGKVIAAKIMALTQEEKAAVLSFCVGYGCDDPLTKSADAALMCLKGGILMPTDHATPCTCCKDYRPHPVEMVLCSCCRKRQTKVGTVCRYCSGLKEVPNSETWMIQSKGSQEYACITGEGRISFGIVQNAFRFPSEREAQNWAENNLVSPSRMKYVRDGGDK